MKRCLLGIKPEGKERVRTSKGIITMGYATVKMKVNGEESLFKTLLTPIRDNSRIGTIVLDTLGFKVNSKTKRLEKTEMEVYQAIVC